MMVMVHGREMVGFFMQTSHAFTLKFTPPLNSLFSFFNGRGCQLGLRQI